VPAAGTLAFATASETLEDALQMPNAARAIIAVKRIRMDCRADQAQQITRPPRAAACGPHYVRNCPPKIFGGPGQRRCGLDFRSTASRRPGGKSRDMRSLCTKALGQGGSGADSQLGPRNHTPRVPTKYLDAICSLGTPKNSNQHSCLGEKLTLVSRQHDLR